MTVPHFVRAMDSGTLLWSHLNVVSVLLRLFCEGENYCSLARDNSKIDYFARLWCITLSASQTILDKQTSTILEKHSDSLWSISWYCLFVYLIFLNQPSPSDCLLLFELIYCLKVNCFSNQIWDGSANHSVLVLHSLMSDIQWKREILDKITKCISFLRKPTYYVVNKDSLRLH